MPIKYKSLYPKNWKAIVAEVKLRAGYRCECPGICASHAIRCSEVDAQMALAFNGIVVLTTAHLCFTPSCEDRKHLMSMCQKCHNRYDNSHRMKNAERTRSAKILAVG